jgi:hypothetical protein
MGCNTDFSDFGLSLAPGIQRKSQPKALALALLLHRAFQSQLA